MLCIQLLKSCSTPWWQTNKQNPCLFFSAQWLQQTHSASFRLARQLALLIKTNSMDFFFLFFILVDLIIRVFHTLTYFLTISWGIFLFPLLLFQAYEKGKLRNEGEKIMKVYCAHTEQLWNKLFSFNITNLKACAKRKLRKAMLPQQFWSASELPPRKGVSDIT